MPGTTFYFDVGSPYAYLAAQRIDEVLPGSVRWQPVLLGGLFKLTGRSSWALGDYRRRQRGMAEIEHRARGYGLLPITWPDPWPSDYLAAMRVVTHAFRVGCGRAVAARAFGDAFARGRDLSIKAHVLDAASRAGLDRAEADGAMRDPEIKATLRDATETAHALGVFGVPTVAVGDELFWGDDRLEDAAACAVSVGPAA
jgi:2-hydroxychromene-2-carboxylate isomerase